MTNLCNILLNGELINERDMFYRIEKGEAFLIDNFLEIKGNNSNYSFIKFDTYFNAFSIEKWKKYTNIKSFYLVLKIKGEVYCSIINATNNHKFNIIKTVKINSDDVKETIIEIPSNINEGLIYFELKAFNDAFFYGGYWGTNQEISNKIKLGICITTFNRQEAVKSSSSRILSFLKEDKIDAELIVVDNGKNVNLEKDDKLILIPNENLGGSGGFARGLYYCKEERKDFTHVLFMDDDASCEVESIFRTYNLLKYSNDEKLAIAGSMLFKHEPNIQWENGANFNIFCKPIGSFRNLYDVKSLLENEKDTNFDYGGWWFYAFPIKFSQYPYPFFVRGDDVNFGLQRQFNQITLNGIATLGDDFFEKESPLTQYLDVRSHFIHHLQVQHLSNDFITLMKVFWRFIVKYSLIYKYASANAQLEAIRDVLKGPEFFENNIDMKEVFAKIRPLSEKEKMIPVSLSDYSHFEIGPYVSYSKLAKFIRIITLNGHLLPKIFFKRKGVILWKSDNRIAAYFRRKKVLIYHPQSKKGFILKHNKKEFFLILFQAILLSYNIFINRKNLIKRYNEKYNYLTSKEYWEKQFFKKKDK